MSAAHLKASSRDGVLTMPGIKTETITMRIDPGVKGGLRTMAERERRSLANMIEIIDIIGFNRSQPDSADRT